jgi:tetratricopeptide (TPR) repeat protein
MPQTINGIGTWYHGKTDIHRLKGVCEFCGNMGELTSYDTTLYFVVFFIPVIPITKYRILEDCPSCQKHRIIKARQWKELKEATTNEVMAKLEANPRDKAALLEALDAVIGYQEKPLLDKLIPLTQPFNDDADVQAKLAACYNYFSMREEATEAYKRSLLAEDRPETRESLAFNLLRAGQPEEAYSLARHVMEEKKREKIYLPFLLIDTYQSQGKHQQALDLLDELEEAFPELAQDKDVKKLRAQSNKYLASGKPVKRATLVDSSRGGVQQGSNFSKWVPILIASFLIIGYFARTFYLGENCSVYLLNGASKPYEVKVQDKTYILQPGSPQLIQVPEGELVVESTQKDYDIPPVKCKVETNFWSRVFKRPVFVVNPDEAAVLSSETSIYAKHPPKPPPPVYIDAKSFHVIDEPDYTFTDFPDSIQVKGNSSITKKRLGVFRFADSTELLSYLQTQVKDAGQVNNKVKRLLMINPNDYILLGWLQRRLNIDEQMKLLQTKLDVEPLLVDWHRAYQDLCFRMKPPRDVRSEYEKRLASASPATKANTVYLLGRVTDEPESITLFREAANLQVPSFFAVYALGNRALLGGDFAEAKKWAEKLQFLDARHLYTMKLTTDVLMATRKYGELEQWTGSQSRAAPGDVKQVLEKFRSALFQGNSDAANQSRQQILAEVRREAPDKVSIIETVLALHECEIQGNAQAYLKMSKGDPNPTDPFIVAILKNDVSDAEQKAKLRDGGEDDSFLLNTSLLYLLARKHQDQKLMDHCWEDMVEDIRTTSRTSKPLIEMLDGKKPFEFEAAQNAFFAVDEKRGVLLVLADRYPSHAARLKALAKKLDFQRDAYSMAIDALVK